MSTPETNKLLLHVGYQRDHPLQNEPQTKTFFMSGKFQRDCGVFKKGEHLTTLTFDLSSLTMTGTKDDKYSKTQSFELKITV